MVTLAEGCQLPSLSVAVTVKKRLQTQTPLCQTAVLIAVRVRLPPLVYCSEGGKTPSPLNERTMVHSGRAAPLGHQ